jgi:DNA-binding ferritin-like protein
MFRYNKMSAELIHMFFELQINLKLYHWMTTSYARHKASDQLVEELTEKIDRFVEVYIGRHGKPKVTGKKQIGYSAMSDKEVVTYLKNQLGYLEKLNLEKYTDLDNIRGEIIEAINQAVYLFALD